MQNKKKQKEGKKKPISLGSQYLSFQIQYWLYLDDQMVRINQCFTVIIIILSSLQQLSFAFENYYFNRLEHSAFKQFFISASQFTRPYTYINESFFKFTFLFPILLIVLDIMFSIYLFVQFIRKKKQKKMDDQINSLKKPIKLILHFLAYNQSMLYYLIFIPQQEMTLLSIVFYLNSNNVGLAVLSLFSYFCVIIYQFFHIYCIQQSIHIRVKNLNFLDQQFNHYLNLFVLILIMIINVMENDQTVKFYLIASLLIFKQLVNIYSLFTTYQNTRRRIQIDLCSETLIFIVTMILLCIEVSNYKSESEDYETELILLIPAIFVSILQNIYNKQHYSMTGKNRYDFKPNELQYIISTVIEEFSWIEKSFTHKKKLVVVIYHFKEQHQLQCTNIKCICHDPNLFLEKIIKMYLEDLVDQFYMSIAKIKIQSIKQLYYFHYLSLIHYLGLSNRAFRQSNIQYQDSDYQQNKQYISSSSLSKTLGPKNNTHYVQSSNSIDHQNSGSKSKLSNIEAERINIKLDNMSFIQKERLFVIQEIIKKTLSTGLGSSSMNTGLSDSLGHAVKLFLKSEECNKQIKRKIIKMINRKKDFFLKLNAQNSNMKLFEEAKLMIVKLTSLEDDLMRLYIQFPSRKMQALNSFYQSELMNNYFQAFKLATVTAISDEKLFKMQSQVTFDLFSSKIDYLIIGFDEQTYKLQIQQASNQIYDFFGLSLEKFKTIKNIEHILPSTFESIHGKLVQNFLSVGDSKYFRQINMNYCRFQLRFIKPIDMFYDINVSNLENLTFACFIKDSQSQNAFIFCCQNYKIQGISKNLISKFGYTNKVLQRLNECYMKQPLSKLFPKLMNQTETHITTENQDLQKEQFDQSEYQILMNVPDVIFLESNAPKLLWDSDQNFCHYQVDAVFHYRKFKQEINSYLIIEIREAKKFFKTFSTPLESEHVTPSGKMSESQQEILDQFQDFDGFENFELEPNIPRAIEFVKPPNQFIDQDQSQSYFQLGKRPKVNEINQSQSYFPNVSLISPKDVTLKLINSQRGAFFDSNSKRDLHQQFFSAQDQKDISSHAEDPSIVNQKLEINYKQHDKITKLQYDEIDKELQENIQMQMQMEKENQNIVAEDDVGSQVSSAIAFQRSKYSKKYDLIQKILKSDKFSNNFYLVRLLTAILFSLYILFSIVEMVFSQNDLNRFLAEIDMMQLKANIIGPSDNYMVAQNAVIEYTVKYMIGMIDQETQNEKFTYAMNDITYNYESLKSSFTRQLQNPYLNSFFNNQSITVVMSNVFTTSKHIMSFREALNQILGSSYQFEKQDYHNVFVTVDFTAGYFVFMFANYQVIYETLTEITIDILQYTNQRAEEVFNRWTALMVPTLVIGLILLIIIAQCYSMYLNQYNQFLQLFQSIELVWLQRDIDRYKGITQLVVKDEDVLFKYQFDIDLKERFLAAEEIRKEKIAQNQKINKSKQKQTYLNQVQEVSRIPSLISLSFIYAICFGFCFLSTSLGGSFVNKYPETTDFFNQLNDISISATAVFSAKKTCYWVKVKTFFFMSDTDAAFYLSQFLAHIEEIDSFLNLMQNVDTSNLITTTAFVDKLQSVLQNDVCSFLPSAKLISAQSHCDAVFGGVLRRGLQATLSTVRNQLLNEQQTTNNFSVQNYSMSEELEAGLIMYDALQNVKSQFQDELIAFTNQLISQINIINISAIIIYGISVLLLFMTITQIYTREFKIVLRFVLLMPQTSLFLDNQLDRNIKQIITKNNLL